MERNDFLKLCREVSKYPIGSGNVRQGIPENLLVICRESVFYPEGYILSFDNGKTQHTAILHSLKANSIVYESLEKVELWKK